VVVCGGLRWSVVVCGVQADPNYLQFIEFNRQFCSVLPFCSALPIQYTQKSIPTATVKRTGTGIT